MTWTDWGRHPDREHESLRNASGRWAARQPAGRPASGLGEREVLEADPAVGLAHRLAGSLVTLAGSRPAVQPVRSVETKGSEQATKACTTQKGQVCLAEPRCDQEVSYLAH